MENIEEYTRDVVTKCVIKICWALGFTSLSSVSAQVLTDVTNRYMKDMCISLHQYMNVYGHLSPTLGDCSLTMLNLAVTVSNLEDFAQNVFPILLDEKIPQYPIQSQPKLNFLKPGSREVVTRPVHIHEHLPAMYPDVSDEDGNSNFDTRSSSLDVIGNLESGSGSSTMTNGGLPNLSGNCDLFKRTATSSTADQETASPTSSSSAGMLKKSKMASEERVQPTRELSCVVMTTSGFLTTKREGKMPEARIPLALTNFTVVNNASGGGGGGTDTNSAAAAPAKSGEQLKVKQSGSSNSSSNNNNNTNSNSKDGTASCKPPPEKKLKLAEEQPIKEVSVSREQPEQQEDRPHSVKATSTKSGGTKTATTLEMSSLPAGSPPLDAFKSKQPVEKPTARTVPHSPTSPLKTQKQSLSRDSEGAEERETVVDGKLTTEPDRVKLSIFKKITKSRDDSKATLLPDQSSSGGGNAVSANNVKEPELTSGKKTHHKEQAAEVGVTNNGSGSVVKGSAANSKAQVVKVKKLTKAGKLSKRQKKLKHMSAAAEKMKKKKSQQTIEPGSPPSSSSSPIEAKKDIIKPAVPMNNPNQPPPPIYPFLSSFTSGAGSLLPSSLSQNPLIPKFVPFPSAPLSGKLNSHTPAVPHPAMPNLPLPPPGMMQVISDDRSKITSKGHNATVTSGGGGEFETEIMSRDLDDEEPPAQATTDTKKLKKEHKKLKKDKKDREKKKKEKRDKVKNVKKLKAGKNKREKNSQKDDKLTAVDLNENGAKLAPVEVVPKLKLKLGSSSPQLSSSAVGAATSVASQSPKITIKPIVKKTANEFRREPSPELAKINALVGKPVKHKSTDSSSSSKFNFVDPIMINVPPAPVTPSTTSSSKKQQEKTRSRAVKEKSSSGRGKRSSAAALETNEPKHAPFYYDDDGNQIWVCPSCGAQDDGSPMIGCDGCDAWYHWVCVGIKSAPESAKWFCSFCRRK